jgi:uncharacterized protein
MRRRIRGLLVSLAFVNAGFLFHTSFAIASKLPPPPGEYVLDEPQVLNAKTRVSLQTLLKAHDQSTGEQIIFSIFQTTQGEDPVAWTNRIFQSWKIGQKGKDNGILLALYWKEHKSRMEVGYGLESKLTDAKSKRILAEVLAPQLKQGNPNGALTQSALEILKVIQSPLLENGQAEQILGGAKISRQQSFTPDMHFSWVWIFVSFLLFFLFGRMFLPSREGTFDRNTWRPSVFHPFRKRRGRKGRDDDFFGGGGFGGGPGDFGGSSGGGSQGGMSGGGGSSGGGGASQDW